MFALETQALGVALTSAGFSNRNTASILGASETSLRRWRKSAKERRTTHGRSLWKMSKDIGLEISDRQEQARLELLDRIIDTTGTASLRDAAQAYTWLSQRHVIRATATVERASIIHEYVSSLSDDELDAELRALEEPIRSRTGWD
jgi:hypothetical protein